MFSVILAFHGYLREQFAPSKNLQKQIAVLEEEKHRAELRSQLAYDQLAEFKSQVAVILPQAELQGPSESNYPLRQLASVVASGHPLVIERASSAFEKAKSEFREKHFEDTSALLKDLIEHHPESTHVIEAHFLLAESQYQMGENEKAVGTIETMISLFPESELTGFSLLRLGKIFEKEERLEDAADIYRSVLNNFQQTEITTQARAALKAVAL